MASVFRRVLLVLLAAGCLSANGGVVKSLVGASGIGGNGGVENPYVQDGLVAMWDGIWNVGWGKHDSTTNNFVDLYSGSRVMVGRAYGSWLGNLAAPTNFSVEANGVRAVNLNSAVGVGISFYRTLGTNYTIEVVRSGTTFRTTNVGDVLCTYPFSGAMELHNYPTSSIRIKAAGITEVTIRSMTLGSDVYSVTAGGRTVFYNGVRYNGMASAYGMNLGPGMLGIGMSGHLGTLHCVRIYSRTLTDDEVAANYAVDKERFGL